MRPEDMDIRACAVYNLARGVLLNRKLTVADCASQPLRVLDLMIGGLGLDSESGLWLTPLRAVPGVPRVFPFDLLYLDKDHRVIETAEMGPGIEFPRHRDEVTSALILPSKILNVTGTQTGDELILCPADELDALLATASASVAGSAAINREKWKQRPPFEAAALTGEDRTEANSFFERAFPSSSFERSILQALSNAVPRSESGEPPSRPQAEIVSDTDQPPGMARPTSEISSEERDPAPPAIAQDKEKERNQFSNWVGSPAPNSTSNAGNNIGTRISPAENRVSGATAQNKANLQRDSSQRTANADLTDNGATKPDVKGKENPAAVEQPKMPPVDPSSQLRPATQRTATPVTRPSRAVPQKIANTQPSASTTTFATSSFPMWHVSAPTAIVPAGSSKPAPTLPQSNERPRSIPPRDPEPKPFLSRKVTDAAPQKGISPLTTPPLAAPEKPAKPSYSETGRQPLSSPPAKSTPPKQEPPRKMWPKIPVEAAPPVSKERYPAQIPTASNANGSKLEPVKPPMETSAAVIAPPSVEPPVPSAVSEHASTGVLKPEPTGKVKPPETDPERRINLPLTGLRSRFKQWLKPSSHPSDRRQAQRRYVPGMIAHYFSGGAPKPHDIADISMTGFYLVTEDRWMTGTMIQMTLQKPCGKGHQKQSITVLSRIVRRGLDGVAAEFVMPESVDSQNHDIHRSQATDRFALARFL